MGCWVGWLVGRWDGIGECGYLGCLIRILKSSQEIRRNNSSEKRNANVQIKQLDSTKVPSGGCASAGEIRIRSELDIVILS